MSKHIVLCSTVVCCLLAGLLSTLALGRAAPAADGALDPSFGTSGLAVIDLTAGSSGANGVAVQPDGRIVLAGGDAGNFGNFAVARLLPDGTLDPSFGTGGHVSTDFDGRSDGASSVLLQPDGKIVAAGAYDESQGFGLVRYLPDGQLDPGFGVGGKVRTDLHGGAPDALGGAAHAIAQQPDRRLIAAGTRIRGPCSRLCYNDLALARYLPDGRLDSTFGDNGIIIASVLDSPDSEANAVVMQPDGAIVVAGLVDVPRAQPPSFIPEFALLRFNPDGTLDSSFGTAGLVTTDFAGLFNQANGLVLQADGKIVAGGTVEYHACDPMCTNAFHFGLARYLADGTLDPGFGDAGRVTTDFPSGNSWLDALTLQPDGRIVAAGSGSARYLPDGHLDPAFGSGGLAASPFRAAAVALQPDGRVVTAGSLQEPGSQFAMGAARYLNTIVPPTPTIGPGCLFADVCPSDYFFTPVQALVARGILSGYADQTFRPYADTTRGQLAKILVLSLGWPIDTSDGPHFNDVPPTHPFYPYVETLVHHGTVSGYADGTFHPEGSITRAQLAKILVLGFGWLIDTTGGPHFGDVPPAHPFYAYIETAYRRAILSGYADGTFHPAGNATRGQIAKLVYNALQQVTPTTPPPVSPTATPPQTVTATATAAPRETPTPAGTPAPTGTATPTGTPTPPPTVRPAHPAPP